MRPSLSGEALAVLTHLTSLRLRRRVLGSLPSQIGLLTKLRQLDIADNRFDGCLPSELGLATALTELLASDNRFDCSVPDELLALPALRMLDLRANNLVSFQWRDAWSAGGGDYFALTLLLSGNRIGAPPNAPFDVRYRAGGAHAVDELVISFLLRCELQYVATRNGNCFNIGRCPSGCVCVQSAAVCESTVKEPVPIDVRRAPLAPDCNTAIPRPAPAPIAPTPVIVSSPDAQFYVVGDAAAGAVAAGPPLFYVLCSRPVFLSGWGLKTVDLTYSRSLDALSIHIECFGYCGKFPFTALCH